MSSIKNDPRNYPPESVNGKENLSDNKSSSTDSINIYICFVYRNIYCVFNLSKVVIKIKNNNSRRHHFLLQ